MADDVHKQKRVVKTSIANMKRKKINEQMANDSNEESTKTNQTTKANNHDDMREMADDALFGKGKKLIIILETRSFEPSLQNIGQNIIQQQKKKKS